MGNGMLSGRRSPNAPVPEPTHFTLYKPMFVSPALSRTFTKLSAWAEESSYEFTIEDKRACRSAASIPFRYSVVGGTIGLLIGGTLSDKFTSGSWKKKACVVGPALFGYITGVYLAGPQIMHSISSLRSPLGEKLQVILQENAPGFKLRRIQYEELDVNNLMSQVGYGDDLSQLQADFKEVATQREEEARPPHKERFTSRSRENRRKRIEELRHHYFHEDEEEDDKVSSSKDF